MLRTPAALAATASLLLNIGCASRPAPPLAPGALPSRAEVTINAESPFVIVGRTPINFSLRCPAYSLTGRLGETRGDTLQFLDVYEHEFASGAAPGCWQIKRGRVVHDPAAPFTITVAEYPRPKSYHRYVVAGVVVVIILAIVNKWQKFGIGDDCIGCTP